MYNKNSGNKRERCRLAGGPSVSVYILLVYDWESVCGVSNQHATGVAVNSLPGAAAGADHFTGLSPFVRSSVRAISHPSRLTVAEC